MKKLSLNEKFNSRFAKLNDLNKQYIVGILQSFEFVQIAEIKRDNKAKENKHN